MAQTAEALVGPIRTFPENEPHLTCEEESVDPFGPAVPEANFPGRKRGLPTVT